MNRRESESSSGLGAMTWRPRTGRTAGSPPKTGAAMRMVKAHRTMRTIGVVMAYNPDGDAHLNACATATQLSMFCSLLLLERTHRAFTTKPRRHEDSHRLER